MTIGALIFAFNNEQTDYVRLAAWSAGNIRRHLGIPVAVVTDCVDHALACTQFDVVIPASAESGGRRYFNDYGHSVTWYNAARTNAYALSPWTQTLVLDADYVVSSNQLKKLFDTNNDFLCHRTAQNVSTGYALEGLNSFGDYRFPMWWATVMWFRRSAVAEYVFACMDMIKQNWQHYRDIYSINSSTYRNDFALSIALGILSGHTLRVDSIPWDLMSSLPEHTVIEIAQDHYKVEFTTSMGIRHHVNVNNTDMHVMGKRSLENIIGRC
jgi:hypothetical protein